MFDIYNPIEASLKKKIINPGENIELSVKPKYGKWDQTLDSKYKYELINRKYTSEKIATLRGESTPIMHSLDTVVRTGDIKTSEFTIDTK